jgi:hypothetical protein
VNVKPHGVHFTDRDMNKNEYYGDLKFSLNNPQYEDRVTDVRMYLVNGSEAEGPHHNRFLLRHETLANLKTNATTLDGK